MSPNTTTDRPSTGAGAPKGAGTGTFGRRALRHPMQSTNRYRIQQSGVDVVILFVLLQAASVIYGLIDPTKFAYTSFGNVVTALETIPLLGIPALGVGVLMIAGEFDLSVGATIIFASMVMGQLNSGGMSVWLAALIALLIGAGIGLINGLLTLRLRIPSFIATLGSFGFWTAAILFVHGAASQTFTASGLFQRLTSGNIGVIPSEFIWMIVIGIGFWGLLQRHRIGNHIFAAGGNTQAAHESGVNVARAKLLAFTLSGTCAALAGVLQASRIGDIAPSSDTNLALNAIAACVIGGLTLTGGRGTIVGMILGASLIYWIQDVLLLVGAPSFYLSAFVGVLIVAAAAIYQQLRDRRV
jgi:simple sugar transport system permease protein